jgi:hypothetical protein
MPHADGKKRQAVSSLPGPNEWLYMGVIGTSIQSSLDQFANTI